MKNYTIQMENYTIQMENYTIQMEKIKYCNVWHAITEQRTHVGYNNRDRRTETMKLYNS
jgi:hypothetical protein